MKKLVISLLVGIVAIGTLVLAAPSQAGASSNLSYCSVDQAPVGMTSVVAGKTESQEVHKAYRDAPSHCAPSTGPQPRASVQIGYFTTLLTLQHADIHSVLLQGFLVGAAAEAFYLCGELPWYLAAACVPAVAVGIFALNNELNAAWNNVTWQVCGVFLAYNWCGPNAQWTPFGTLIQPVEDSGLNVLFSDFPPIPIAWQVNPYSG